MSNTQLIQEKRKEGRIEWREGERRGGGESEKRKRRWAGSRRRGRGGGVGGEEEGMGMQEGGILGNYMHSIQAHISMGF